MNSSTTPAKNETVPYGALLAQSGKLKRNDQVLLVKALAGQLGMIAVFPGQFSAMQGTGGASPAKAGKSTKEKKGPAKQEPTNPLSGSPEKKAFDAAKKAVAKATKESGSKLPDNHELVVALNESKDHYFRSLSNAKGSKTQDPSGSEDGKSAKADNPTVEQAAKPPANYLKVDAQGAHIWWNGKKWLKATSDQIVAWNL